MSPKGITPVDGFTEGHLRSLKHGALSERIVGPLSADVLAVVDELVAGTPAAHPPFTAARAVLARKVARVQLVALWLEEHGILNAKGTPWPAARYEQELIAGVEKSLSDLGLTPTAAAKLGVDLARTETLADEITKAQQARRAAEAKHG